ncbi:MAG: hypothetical protein AAFW66_04115 [Pseudomonadota bacterium]
MTKYIFRKKKDSGCCGFPPYCSARKDFGRCQAREEWLRQQERGDETIEEMLRRRFGDERADHALERAREREEYEERAYEREMGGDPFCRGLTRKFE